MQDKGIGGLDTRSLLEWIVELFDGLIVVDERLESNQTINQITLSI
jgi:hypothetical protein